MPGQWRSGYPGVHSSAERTILKERNLHRGPIGAMEVLGNEAAVSLARLVLVCGLTDLDHYLSG
jgi:hypothetical protein